MCIRDSIITATFYMMHSIPGDPLAHMARNLPEQTKANYYAKYGLDKSTTEQYGIFMKNLITKGDLGAVSYTHLDVYKRQKVCRLWMKTMWKSYS